MVRKKYKALYEELLERTERIRKAQQNLTYLPNTIIFNKDKWKILENTNEKVVLTRIDKSIIGKI